MPVRLMRRDLLFLAQTMTAMLDEQKAAILVRDHGTGKSKESQSPAKLLTAFLPKAEEGKLGCILIETAILLSMRSSADAAPVLREAARVYKVDVDAIAAKLKQEFAEKAKSSNRGPSKPQKKSATKKAA